MTLKDYLTTHGLTETAFAELAKLEVSTVHRAANRKVLPSPATIRKIEAATAGAVRPNDFYPSPTPPKRKSNGAEAVR